MAVLFFNRYLAWQRRITGGRDIGVGVGSIVVSLVIEIRIFFGTSVRLHPLVVFGFFNPSPKF